MPFENAALERMALLKRAERNRGNLHKGGTFCCPRACGDVGYSRAASSGLHGPPPPAAVAASTSAAAANMTSKQKGPGRAVSSPALARSDTKALSDARRKARCAQAAHALSLPVQKDTYMLLENSLRSVASLDALLGLKSEQIMSELDYVRYLELLYSRMGSRVDMTRVSYVTPPAAAAPDIPTAPSTAHVEAQVEAALHAVLGDVSEQLMGVYLDYLLYMLQALQSDLSGAAVAWLDDTKPEPPALRPSPPPAQSKPAAPVGHRALEAALALTCPLGQWTAPTLGHSRVAGFIQLCAASHTRAAPRLSVRSMAGLLFWLLLEHEVALRLLQSAPFRELELVARVVPGPALAQQARDENIFVQHKRSRARAALGLYDVHCLLAAPFARSLHRAACPLAAQLVSLSPVPHAASVDQPELRSGLVALQLHTAPRTAAPVATASAGEWAGTQHAAQARW